MSALSGEQVERWERDGYFVLPHFASDAVVRSMGLRAVTLAREADARDGAIAPAYVLGEPAFADREGPAEERVSKIFRIHRSEPVFEAFARDERLLSLVSELLRPELDCFLSQFIFKNPGAMGQPWHQDAFYFPFDRGPQVGVWVAITEATRENGPLWVLPGSHRQPVHDVVGDRREHAPMGYVEIVGQDTAAEVPALMHPGDVLVFHSHLMHRSTDNVSERRRAAMVYHFATAGTVDQSQERWGFTPPNVDWMPVRRAGSDAPS